MTNPTTTDGTVGDGTTTDGTVGDGTVSNEEAEAILADEAHRVATVWRALDVDGDGVISADEIDQASASLLTLDANGDGRLTIDEIGGPFRWPGGERRSAIVRILDLDGDGVITAEDIADAPARLRRLDRVGQGHLLPRNDRPPWNPILAQAHSGPAETLAHFDVLRDYKMAPNGPIMPGADPRQDDGYLLIYEHCNAGDVQVGRDLFLQAGDGTRIHKWPDRLHASETVTAHLRDDGLLLRSECPGIWLDVLAFPVGAHGIISLAEPDGTVVWEYRLFEPGKRVMHHDFEPMPNGNILVTVYEGRTFEEAVDFGWTEQARDVLMRPPDLQRWWTETILELEPNLDTGETRIVWEWHSADHLVQDVDPNQPHYGPIGPGCRKIDVNYARYPRYRFNMGQIMHVNTISYNETHDQIMLSSAMHSELWVIDHATTTGEARGEQGDLLYRWGNPSAHKGGPESDKVLDWQHDIHWIPDDVPHDGDILIFNNGSRRPGDDSPNPDPARLSFANDAYSEILEVRLPVDDHGNWTWDTTDPMLGAEIVWSWNEDGNQDWFSPFMSGARRRRNGNTVAALGYNKRIREITPDGETVLDFKPGGPGRTFRVVPIAADHPGIARLGLPPRFERVAGPYSFTEGPVWDGTRITFTDIPPSRIMTFDPATGAAAVAIEETEKTNGLAFDADGHLYGCQDAGRRVVRFNADGSRTVVADAFEGNRLNSPNDLSIDRDGRIWFSDPRYGPDRDDMELDHESVYLATPDAVGDDGAPTGYRLKRVTYDTMRPNGVLLDADQTTLFVAESPRAPAGRRELRAYPIGPDFTLGAYDVLHDFGDHRGVDGMTLAPDGSLLVACGWVLGGPGPRIAVFGADRELRAEIPTAINPSNLCFGGPEGHDLYVTNAKGELLRIGGFVEALAALK